ncbi:MAG: DeoR family transcriptional regulator [Clostridia bacterium]|nr:DeoR family transcriptional regulator [Clostridia bacterium]
MEAIERRMAIWFTLCRQRQVTISHLSEKYKVSPRTIRYDIEVLSRTYPIETRVGKNGGIKLADWYQPGSDVLRAEHMDFLLDLVQRLKGEEAAQMREIISLLSQDC